MSERGPEPLEARLRALFLGELEDNLRALTRGLVELERHPGEEVDAVLVQELFRAAHSLKGAAHSAGVVAAVEPCRRLEAVLARLRADPAPVGDDVLRSFAGDLATLADLERDLAVGSRPVAQGAGVPPAGPVGGGAVQVRARVAVDALEGLVHQAGALMAATERLRLVTTELVAAGDATADLAAGAVAVERELARAAAGITETAQQLRLQPIGDVTGGLEHAVREVSRSTGKAARLVVHGDDVELDRDVGDALREPLLHLVRNAVDHGLELPREREASGKPPIGTVGLTAALVGGRVRVTVTDDGAGVDLGRLRDAAGTGTGTPVDDLELAFLPGVSTASSVSDVSGRGVGLDAVRVRIESLGGTVQLRSRPGVGTEVTLDVPMTLAVVRVTVVAVGGELLAVPVATIGRLRRIADGDLRHVDGRQQLLVGGASVPAVALGAALGFPSADGATPPGIGIELLDEQGVLLVDRIEGELEGLVRRLPRRAATTTTVGGAMVLASGRVALVVNPSACFRAGAALATPAPVVATPGRRPTVLLAEDSLTTRALEHGVLEGAGYDVIDAVDGAEAWQVLTERDVDLVVSDVDMPRMGGIELCRAIRSSARLAELPVVLVTSMAADDDVRRGVEAGANAYLVKSTFEQAALLDAVRRLL